MIRPTQVQLHHTSHIAYMRKQLNLKLKDARTSRCFQNPRHRHCPVLWDTIEELSARIHNSQKIINSKSNTNNYEKTELDSFCSDFPWDDQCSTE